LPWHIARLCFLPDFADPRKAFAPETKLLAESIASEPSSLAYDVKDARLFVARRGSLNLTVNAAIGEFSIDHVDDDDDWHWIVEGSPNPDLRGLPEEFFTQSEHHDFTFRPEYHDDGVALLELSRRLWQSMDQGFRSSLRDGSAQVYGRWRSVDECFKRVYLDQLLVLEPRVRIEDENWLSEFDCKTILENSGGAQVLSPYIACSRTIKRSKGDSNEHRAAMDLAAYMKKNPPRPKAAGNTSRASIYRRPGLTREFGLQHSKWPEVTAGIVLARDRANDAIEPVESLGGRSN
jgi:hypothetical protein